MPSPNAAPTEQFVSAHFVFSYTPLDAANIVSTANAVEGEYARIIQDLGSDALPPINVRFYTDPQEMVRAVAPIGPVPSWASGLATTQSQIHLMSPNHPSYAPYTRMVSNLVHEFAHCVSIHINPRFSNNPRWFWESVAIYESGQFVDPRTLSYMLAGTPPSFSTLNSLDNTLVYDVGYTIAEFIVARAGKDALDRLVVNNGDVDAALGMSQTSFERAWFEFVRSRYGI